MWILFLSKVCKHFHRKLFPNILEKQTASVSKDLFNIREIQIQWLAFFHRAKITRNYVFYVFEI